MSHWFDKCVLWVTVVGGCWCWLAGVRRRFGLHFTNRGKVLFCGLYSTPVAHVIVTAALHWLRYRVYFCISVFLPFLLHFYLSGLFILCPRWQPHSLLKNVAVRFTYKLTLVCMCVLLGTWHYCMYSIQHTGLMHGSSIIKLMFLLLIALLKLCLVSHKFIGSRTTLAS
jgi:hypothetical protein